MNTPVGFKDLASSLLDSQSFPMNTLFNDFTFTLRYSISPPHVLKNYRHPSILPIPIQPPLPLQCSPNNENASLFAPNILPITFFIPLYIQLDPFSNLTVLNSHIVFSADASPYFSCHPLDDDDLSCKKVSLHIARPTAHARTECVDLPGEWASKIPNGNLFPYIFMMWFSRSSSHNFGTRFYTNKVIY